MYQRILIAIDPENENEGKRALEFAMTLMTENGELHLASAYNVGGGGFFPYITEDAPEQKEAEVRKTLDKIVRKYLPINRHANLHVLAGNTGKKLVSLGGQLNADLMILISRGSSGYWPVHRATVEYVSVNAACPVLVLPSLEKITSKNPDGLNH